MAKINFKESPIHTNGNLPPVSSKAPDFQLVDASLNEKSLKDFKGKRKLLSIVPSLDTQVCAISAKKFNDIAKQHPEVVILFISADLPFAQKRICGVDKLENIHTLSMMRSKRFAEDYGILILDGPLAGLCARSVVVLDESDKVIYTELVSEVTHEVNYEKATHMLLGT